MYQKNISGRVFRKTGVCLKAKTHMDVKAKVHWPRRQRGGVGVGPLQNIQAYCLRACLCASNCFPFSSPTG